MSIESITIPLGSTEMTIETGKMAKLADGAVTVTTGDTVVLVTAVSATSIREGQSWFPMSVEYKEKAAAAGQFPGGYFKREGRPTEKEILTCRMTDRPLRPLFPKGYLYDTQIIALLLSADQVNDGDILGMNGASAALALSDIPFAGPMGAVRVGLIDGEFVTNPTHEQREVSELDLIYCGIKDKVIMIEGDAQELTEDEFKQALTYAQAEVNTIVDAIQSLVDKVGKEKRVSELFVVKQEVLDIASATVSDRMEDAIFQPTKNARGKKMAALQKEVEAAIVAKLGDGEVTPFMMESAFDYLQKQAFRVAILDKGKRADGRGCDDIRPLSAEIDILPRTHGSALFARGETQALGIATLAPLDASQFFDNYSGGPDSKHFILHYNFPPFSVGETGRMGGLNRREIGHGNLAERSIVSVLPDEADFPYAMRVTSEVMESNGSTSMASVCSGVMALLDAGVPLKAPVAGISCGLVTEMDDNGAMKRYNTIVDIIGSEDFFGDMDFKLCGTTEGITAYQLDLKLAGIPLDILFEGIDKTGAARHKLIDVMNAAITDPGDLSAYAPRIKSIKIDPDRIGELIGPGGKNIKGIQAESGADVNIEDDGTVHVYAAKEESLNRAFQMIEGMFAEIEIGKLYTGKVVSTTKFGAFMSVLPGKDGLIHISELSDSRVERTEDVVKVGEMITAKCVGIDDKGRVKMSRKAAMADADSAVQGGPPAENADAEQA